ncbi:MAG: hypothetical protein A2Y62_11230 [Candidatus Fischerbacteria bacterium RBG_13_37_8]|uniref:DUF1828 domain-containing protein n=1 Tax=Candidatus Fischerbacteria bacterium RBG_13_37_8 TaxID=1817863 RepID=A0A1F5VW85_9BACT|nr:MAG: hypothetical protein A2Y62_11230 [Candidatus Fischerbacteria bacterium RBG_13_37_8]
MTAETIIQDFRRKVCEGINLSSEGANRYIVFTPFMFDDGDHLAIILKLESNNWFLTDEGHTFMHISYDDINFEQGTRAEIIDRVLLSYGIKSVEGELRAYIENDNYGDALYSFIQGLIKINDISYLKRERARSTFLEDFRNFLTEKIPENKREFDYNDPVHDPKQNYIVDCRINSATRPIYVFAIPNDDRCNIATMTCLHYEKFKIPFIATAVFESQEEINRRVLARFSDVCEKQFPSLQSAQERFEAYQSLALSAEIAYYYWILS